MLVRSGLCIGCSWMIRFKPLRAMRLDELRDQFIRKYQADFDITLEDVMSSFLGMEIEQGT